MIGSLRGEVLERWGDGTVLIDVAGVGYEVTVSPRTFGELEPTTSAFLYIHHHIREDDQTLYGFLTRDERSTFKTLIATHGVGPALALAILATYPPAALVDVVANGDFGALKAVPGVGPKTAQRLLVELRDRLSVPVLDGDLGADGGVTGRRPSERCVKRWPGSATAPTRSATPCASCRATARRRVDDAARRPQAARSQACVTSSSIPASTTTPTRCCRSRAAAAAARRVRRPGRAEGAPRHRPRGGAPAPAGGRPPAVRRTPRARQDDAGDDRRRRDGRAAARHVRTGAGARRRPRRHPHQARRPRRAVRRRDPPAVASGRGDPLPGDGGLPARHRRRQGPGGVEHPPVAAAVHARRRHDPDGDDHGAAPRPIRTGRPARLLRRRRTAGDRRARRRHPRRQHRRGRGVGDRPARPRARRGSPTGCCVACATSPRSAATAASTPPPPSAA